MFTCLKVNSFNNYSEAITPVEFVKFTCIMYPKITKTLTTAKIIIL